MENLLSNLVDLALKHNSTYADCRYVKDNYELLEARNGSPFRISDSCRSGIGIRVLLDGAWGFASTNDLKGAALEKSLKTAIKIAKVTAENTKTKKELCSEKIYQDTYHTPHKFDPFSVNTDEKIIPLVEGTKLLIEQDSRIKNASA